MSKAKKSCCSGCLVKVLGAMLVIAFIGIVGFNIIQRTLIPNNNAKPKLWERVATIHDIELEESYSFPVSISLKVVPKEDIKDLLIIGPRVRVPEGAPKKRLKTWFLAVFYYFFIVFCFVFNYFPQFSPNQKPLFRLLGRAFLYKSPF